MNEQRRTEPEGGTPPADAGFTSVTRLASRLRESSAGDWTDDGVRALIDRLGWKWRDSARGPRAVTGHPAGEARPRPVGRFESPYVTSEEYVELAVPVERTAPDEQFQAMAFRRAADELTSTLGTASLMGSYGRVGPYYDTGPDWGTPYLRWRGPEDTLELRAGTLGPELVLQPTAPVENWFWNRGHGGEGAIGGFFGERSAPSNEGLALPAGWYAREWDRLTWSLTEFLTTLPAETTALGVGVTMPVHGRVGGEDTLLFDVICRGRLFVGCFRQPGPDPESLGWGRADRHPRSRSVWDDDDPVWRMDAGGPGRVHGSVLAAAIVSSARAAGVASPTDLTIGAEAEAVGPFNVTYYGLGMRTG